ncbi:MAG: hypothetical protein CVU88_04820, partial [Firmicutes bacterium HGW-Firmicutes-13]
MTTLIALTRASIWSPFLNPASCKLSLVITDVSRALLSPQPPTHMVIWAINPSYLMSSISPCNLFLTPASIELPPFNLMLLLFTGKIN